MTSIAAAAVSEAVSRSSRTDVLTLTEGQASKALLFEEQRPRLLRISARITRSAADAEDIVQEAWLRWHHIDLAEVDNVDAFLGTVVVRLALDRLRQIKARREVYYGDWPREPAAAQEHEQAAEPSSVYAALMVLCQRLSPLERAAFVLRVVLHQPYSETADALGRAETAVRQLVHRGWQRLNEGTVRFAVDERACEGLVHRFRVACYCPDIGPLLELMGSHHCTAASYSGRSSSRCSGVS
jgi:RNA polymerase sigma-70 factor (ECF subfamily)